MYPEILYTQYGFVADTEGAGEFRSAVAVAREWQYHGGEDAILQLRVDRRFSGPYGVDGGECGAPLKALVNPPGQSDELDTGKVTMALHSGDTVRIQVEGAGGWSPPGNRSPGRVEEDVRNELVSIERAREIYRVVIDKASLELDEAATAQLRTQAKSSRAQPVLHN